VTVTALDLFDDLIVEIAARLDLRAPNQAAIRTLAAEVSQHYDVDGGSPPFEAVIDSATGVGKTYILTGSMELLASTREVRDFVIVTPGRTILEKTKDALTPGHAKSLLGPMSFQPTVITADNFATPAMRAAMDDDAQIKIYLFSVQSLIKPQSNTGRRTHTFQEGLGAALYAHLQAIDRLVVFADEHHCYYGPAFSKAVRDLGPWVLLGLTATPHPKTPPEQIIFRYPLAAAIADRLVKTPVIVGRRDDRTDPLTKLTDGVTLLRAKADAVAAYCNAKRVAPVNPAMLVVANNIDEADEYGIILRSSEFFGGTYADAVLVVHSSAPDEALSELAKVEESTSPVRIIVSVGMLKEGWDVRNVYVIASMRASVSEILTEQTLGRGMRLPFGAYTDVEILDTLEVVAHERYEDLLNKVGALNEAFIDYRTRAIVRVDDSGQRVAVIETVEAEDLPVVRADAGSYTAAERRETADVFPPGEAVAARPGNVDDGVPAPIITSTESRRTQAASSAFRMTQEIHRRADAPHILLPVLRMTTVQSAGSLADIPDARAFRALGETLAANPDDELNRTLIGARVVVGSDGIRRTEMVRIEATDHIHSTPSLFFLDELRSQLADMVLVSPAVPARRNQRAQLEPYLDAFIEGLGDRAEVVLSANVERAGARLVRLVAEELRRYIPRPSFESVVEIQDFGPLRATDREIAPDHFGFRKSFSYEGWSRSLFNVEWFDSSPELAVANMLDASEEVACWVRLHINELPILWNSEGRRYNPDFIVIESNGDHLIVEVKRDSEMESDDVQAKRAAARRWANHVSADPEVGATWRYLLVSEDDVATAKNSWAALRRLGS
jgi:type III restriction enzyme